MFYKIFKIIYKQNKRHARESLPSAKDISLAQQKPRIYP